MLPRLGSNMEVKVASVYSMFHRSPVVAMSEDGDMGLRQILPFQQSSLITLAVW